MTDLSFINISERAYKYIRQFTIKNIDDALVELITNCNDAYSKTDAIEREIMIEIFDETRVKVRDKALGLTSAQLSSCFLQVGNYTSSDSSRGFFSRGAKDISALGDLTFNTIKNGKYSQCILNTDAYGMVTVYDQDATDDIRASIGLPGSLNGLEVTIDLLPSFQSINIDILYQSLCNLGVLRDINANKTNNFIYLKKFVGDNTTPVYNQRVFYDYPQADLILDLEYIVPNYPDKTAKFVVYKSKTPIPQPIKETTLQFGFLIKDDTSIYEVNTIDDKFRWNPYINYIYGYVKCNAIKDLLVDYDANGPSVANPYPIIDPSRLTGVNKQHPLIVSMMTIPLLRLDLILRELNNTISSKSVTIEDVDDLLEELSKYSIDIIQKEDVKLNFLPTYDGNLIKAISDDRANYVTYEKKYVLNSNYLTEDLRTENYINEQLLNLGYPVHDAFYVPTDDKGLLQIQNGSDLINDPINILDLLPQNILDQLNKNPYIYKLSTNGFVSKLYVFQKGKIDDDTLNSDNFTTVNRQFTIKFINDLNIPLRYIIDNTSGIVIKLNLNNPIIAKYLTNKNVGDIHDFISLAEISSTKSLVFMKELVTDVLADLIIGSDASNGKLVLDSSSYNNSQKLLEFRNNVVSRIELSVDKIFEKYIVANTTKKYTAVNEDIATISAAVLEKIPLTPELTALTLKLKSLLIQLIE